MKRSGIRGTVPRSSRIPLIGSEEAARGLRLPTEPCVRTRTRLLMQGKSIEKHQTSAPVSGRSGWPASSRE